MEMVESLKNNKSPGYDGIDAEMLKYGGEDLLKKLYELILEVWVEEKMPKEWTIAIICSVLKK